MFAVLTAVFSQILIPIGPVPINLALIAVFTSALLMDIKYSVFGQVIYVLLGIIGIPVFAGFKSGIGTVFGPTGGYIFSYIISVAVISLFVKLFKNKTLFNLIGLVIGLLLCYLIGTVWFVFITGRNFADALMICVVPFIVGDVVKIALSLYLGKVLKKTKMF